jgi:hypothetical protein
VADERQTRVGIVADEREPEYADADERRCDCKVEKKVRCGVAGRGRERLRFRRIGRVAALYSATSGRVTNQSMPTCYCVNGPTRAVSCWAGPNGPLGPAVVPRQAARFRPCCAVSGPVSLRRSPSMA